MPASDTPASGPDHRALLYRDLGEYAEHTGRFIEAGRSAGEPVLVADSAERLERLREGLGTTAAEIKMLDITGLARNPTRLLPAIRDWVVESGEPKRPKRVVGAPTWPAQGPEEQVELIRHEALANLAFAGAPVSIMCPYDISALGPELLAGVECTHPRLIRAGEPIPSGSFADPLDVWRAEQWPLPKPEAVAETVEITRDLGVVRRFTQEHGRRAGVAEPRLGDLVLAVDEAATNALIHGRPPATLRIWRAGARLVCEVTDHGHLADPLAGRRRPQPQWPDGRGLWLIGQVCDLVELRPLPGGTTIRLHLDIDA